MDPHFTSYSILQYLLEHGLAAEGTVSAHRRDVPACLHKDTQRDLYSTFDVYERNKKVTIISYVPRKNSNVLLMTSCHTKLEIDNQRDGDSMDSMDARVEDSLGKRKSNRYTILMLYLIADVCINNLFILMSHQQSYHMTKKRIIKELSALLVIQHIEVRYQNQIIYEQTKDAFIRYGLPPKSGRLKTSVIKRQNPSKCQEQGCRKST
ncbi:hypothetical protein T10_2736 [Trichinella papuae]|uniref:PiggyBac transposable element-derived protein domain-containing protein n=1 Tax=Trichinella papuae TaxID=268474 RepID=A0A0V1MYY0_9BILA|nr:hypothetical protein T10_2736 [Trichinella papuae]